MAVWLPVAFHQTPTGAVTVAGGEAAVLRRSGSMMESMCTYSAPLCQHPTWLPSKQLLRHGDTLASTFQQLKQSSGRQREAASVPEERGVSSGVGQGLQVLLAAQRRPVTSSGSDSLS